MDDTDIAGVARAIIVLVAGIIGCFAGLAILGMVVGMLYIMDPAGFTFLLIVECSCFAAVFLARALPDLLARIPRCDEVVRRNGFMPSGHRPRRKKTRLSQAEADKLSYNTYG